MATKGLSVLFFRHQEGSKPRKELCGVCGTRMDMTVQRCASGFAQAMAGITFLNDEYRCPHSDKFWHLTAEDIVKEAEATQSPSLKKILVGDVLHMCRENIGNGNKRKQKEKKS